MLESFHKHADAVALQEALGPDDLVQVTGLGPPLDRLEERLGGLRIVFGLEEVEEVSLFESHDHLHEIGEEFFVREFQVQFVLVMEVRDRLIYVLSECLTVFQSQSWPIREVVKTDYNMITLQQVVGIPPCRRGQNFGHVDVSRAALSLQLEDGPIFRGVLSGRFYLGEALASKTQDLLKMLLSFPVQSRASSSQYFHSRASCSHSGFLAFTWS